VYTLVVSAVAFQLLTRRVGPLLQPHEALLVSRALHDFIQVGFNLISSVVLGFDLPER